MRMIVCTLLAMALGGSGCSKAPTAAPAAGSGSASTIAPTVATLAARPSCDKPAKLVPACGLEYLRYFVGIACACKTPACATDAAKSFHDWTQTAMDNVDMTVEPTPAQSSELDKLSGDMARCLGMNAAPDTDTDTPTPTEQPEPGSAGSGSGS